MDIRAWIEQKTEEETAEIRWYGGRADGAEDEEYLRYFQNMRDVHMARKSLLIDLLVAIDDADGPFVVYPVPK